jgi:hypothetical protein
MPSSRTVVEYEGVLGTSLEVEFFFSRMGDCDVCGGSGTIERYRFTNGGKCWSCRGTGGKRPGPGEYEVYRCAGHHDIKDGCERSDKFHLGRVKRVVKGWTNNKSEEVYGTRKEAAFALFKGRSPS